MRPQDYELDIRPLSTADGGGYVATAPELPGCRSDGETPDTIRQRMRDRGRKYLNCYGHKAYDGVTVDLWKGRREKIPMELDGEVFIDFETYYRHHTRPSLGLLRRSRFDHTVASETTTTSRGKLTVTLEGNALVDDQLADEFSQENRRFFRTVSRQEALDMPEYVELMRHQVAGFALQSRQWRK